MANHSVARLIGTPPCYVGYEVGGYLTEAVRRKPYSVVLLDEVEKAHPDVFNILLQVLDDGRLTDGQGRTVDFRNTVIIMTSNIGSQIIQGLADDESDKNGHDNYDIMKTAVLAEVGKHFRPEFINRVDEMVVFHSLSRQQIRNIANIQIQGLRDRMAQKDLSLELSDEALDKLSEAGFDPVYGARPLKRAIQNSIENPLAQEILAAKLVPGSIVLVGLKNGKFTFKPGAAAGAKHRNEVA